MNRRQFIKKGALLAGFLALPLKALTKTIKPVPLPKWRYRKGRQIIDDGERFTGFVKYQ